MLLPKRISLMLILVSLLYSKASGVEWDSTQLQT